MKQLKNVRGKHLADKKQINYCRPQRVGDQNEIRNTTRNHPGRYQRHRRSLKEEFGEFSDINVQNVLKNKQNKKGS